jgi:Tol biopolymer transport system component
LADGTRLFGRDRPEDATMRVPQVWAPDDSGIDYVVTRAGVSNIWRMPLAGGPPLQITHFATGRIFSFAWSPDGRWLSLASGSARKDAVLLSSDR